MDGRLSIEALQALKERLRQPVQPQVEWHPCYACGRIYGRMPGPVPPCPECGADEEAQAEAVRRFVDAHESELRDLCEEAELA
jgi:rRNA maturation endonuclease Nob1